MEENRESPRKPAPKDDKPKSRTNAPTSGHTSRPDSRANTTEGQHRSAGDRPKEGGSGYRGPRSQGSTGQGDRTSRPQGSNQHSASGPRTDYKPREGGSSGGYGGRPRPAAGQSGGSGPRPQGTSSARPASAPVHKNAGDDDIAIVPVDGIPEEKVLKLPKKTDANYSMSYRGSSQRANSRGPSSPNRQTKRGSQGQRPKEASKRQSMLNTHKIAPFKYDMNEILSQSSMDPVMASSFLASVIAKASRISTRDAKDYAKTFVDEGNLTKDEYDRICRLMDRYSKYR
ncbi:hypothetical protein [Methanomethylophilus alvi]|uniref:hypothetical protein n=1 Tax=Methanomethylophilus alvi TaxID=1291540 RepID=UPI0037DD99FF